MSLESSSEVALEELSSVSSWPMLEVSPLVSEESS
jgi:hypothetical protein